MNRKKIKSLICISMILLIFTSIHPCTASAAGLQQTAAEVQNIQTDEQQGEAPIEYIEGFQNIKKFLKDYRTRITLTEDVNFDFLINAFVFDEVQYATVENFTGVIKNPQLRNFSAKLLDNCLKFNSDAEKMINIISEEFKKDKEKEEKYLKKFLNIYDEMSEELDNIEDGLTPEETFVQAMMIQNEAYLKTARLIIKITDNKNVSEFAKYIKKIQEEQINEMVSYLEKYS